MSLALMLVLQAAAPAAPAPAAPLPIDFDLARVRPTDLDVGTGGGCRRDGASEILVCGQRPRGGAYPFAEMARRYATRPIVAEMGLGGNLTGDVHVESAPLDRGAVANRAMVRIRLPF